MGSPGDPAVNGGDAIYELRPIYFAQTCFGNMARRGASGRKKHRVPILCMRDHCGGWQLGAETRGGAYPDFYFFC